MPDNDSLERLYTPGEIAEYFQVSPYTVRSWLISGVLVGVKVGGGHGRWRVRESELRKFATKRHGDSDGATNT